MYAQIPALWRFENMQEFEVSESLNTFMNWKTWLKPLVDTFPSIGGGNATRKNAMILSKGKENWQWI